MNGLDRLRAKWPLAERRYSATIRKVDAEKGEVQRLTSIGIRAPGQLFVSFSFFLLRFANA